MTYQTNRTLVQKARGERTRLKILFLTGNFPYPPTDGWKIRVFYLLRSLAQCHEVSIVSFIRTTEDNSAVGDLRRYCRDVRVLLRDPRYSVSKLLRGVVSRVPFSILNYSDPRMEAVVTSVLREQDFDIVQVESIQMSQYSVGLDIPTILDLHNIESVLMKRYAMQERRVLRKLYAEMTWRKLAAYEQEVCPKFTQCLTCSAEDAMLLREHTGAQQVSVIPNGVDVNHYGPMPLAAHAANRIVFVGRMDYHANVEGVRWFCRDILPHIRARRPDVMFQIVGGYPPEEITQLAVPRQIELTGFVDDVRPYLHEAAVVVTPLRVGGGTRLKILEALAAGKAVVSTTVGAEGLGAMPGRDILLADDPREFAEQTLRALENVHLRTQLGRAGRRLVETTYTWERVGQGLEEVYRSCLERHKKEVAC